MRLACASLALITLLPSCGDGELGALDFGIFVQPVSMVSSWSADGTVRVEGDVDILLDSWTPNTYALDAISITPANIPNAVPLSVHLELDTSQWPVEVSGEEGTKEIIRRVHFVATGPIPDFEIGFCPTEALFNIEVQALTQNGSASNVTVGSASHTCTPCGDGAESIVPALDWISESQQTPGQVDSLRELVVDGRGDLYMVILSVQGLYLERVGPDDEFKRIDLDPRFKSFVSSGRLTAGQEPGALVYWGEPGTDRTLSRLDPGGGLVWTHRLANRSHHNAFAASEGRLFFTAGDDSGGVLDDTVLTIERGNTLLASVDQATGTLIATGATALSVLDMLPGPNGTFAVLGLNGNQAQVEMFDRDLTLLWLTDIPPIPDLVPAVVSEAGTVFLADGAAISEYDTEGGTLRFTLPYVPSSLTRTDDGSLLAGGLGTASKLLANGDIEAVVGSVHGSVPWCPLSTEYRVGYGGSSPAIAFATFNQLGAPNLFAGRIAP